MILDTSTTSGIVTVSYFHKSKLIVEENTKHAASR
jgi:hypothetical protein